MVQVTQQKKMVVVGDEVLPLGMKLAGVKESYVVKTAEQVERLLLSLFERKDVGIIVITAGLAGLITDRRIRYLLDNSIAPVVMVVAGYGEKAVGEDEIRKLVRRVVGMDIVAGRGAGAGA